MRIVNLKKKLNAMGVTFSDSHHNSIEFKIDGKLCHASYGKHDGLVWGYSIDLYHDSASQETVRSFPSNFAQLIRKVKPSNHK